MNTRAWLLALLALAAATSFPLQAGIVTINFDEFTSPPVTCCYANTGVTGPLNYPTVLIVDDSNAGYVMNYVGWGDMQTSGDNLFGTLSGAIYLYFNQPVSGLYLDVINGIYTADFTLNLYDRSQDQIFHSVFSLNNAGSPGSVAHLNPPTAAIWEAEILGNGDFAIDTVGFNTSAVPEPSSLVLVAGAVVAFGLRRLRRRT